MGDILKHFNPDDKISYLYNNVKTWLERVNKDSQLIVEENEIVLSAVIKSMNKFIVDVKQQTYEDVSFHSKCSAFGCLKASNNGSILHTSSVADMFFIFPCGHLFHLGCLTKTIEQHLQYKCKHCADLEYEAEKSIQELNNEQHFKPVIEDINEPEMELDSRAQHDNINDDHEPEEIFTKQPSHSSLSKLCHKLEKVNLHIEQMKAQRSYSFFGSTNAQDPGFLGDNMRELLRQVHIREEIKRILRRSCPKCTHIAIPTIFEPIMNETLDYDQ